MSWFKRMLISKITGRLVFIIIGTILAFGAEYAKADYISVKYHRIVFGAYTTPTPLTDPMPVCTDFVTWYDGYLTSETVAYVSNTATDCTYKRSGQTTNQNASITWFKDCSDGLGYRGWNTTPGGNNGNCLGTPPPPPCEAGCNGACGSNRQFSTWGSQSCISGCIYNLGAGFGVSYPNGQESIFFDVRNNTGTQCTNDPNPPTAGPEACDPICECTKKGKSHGTVNGVVVCVDAGTPNTPPVSTKAPPKITTTTPAPTPENPNPEPVTTTTEQPIITVGGGGTGTNGQPNPDVTETVTNPDGSKFSETQDQESYCAANPTAAICKAKRTCDEYPDSPMCKYECEKFPELLACSEMGEIPTPETISTIERNIGLISLPTLPEANSCPAPESISIGGYTITMSYQPVCQYASAFKPLVIAAAWLSAAFIVVGFRGNE